MTIGHRLSEDELTQATPEELFKSLGEGDTPSLIAQRYTVDTDHDLPTGAGNSLDRKTIYIDRQLYQEVMDGAFSKTGLTPQQIIDRWLDHEHKEVCITDGDTAVDTYTPAHERALASEHLGVLVILGTKNAKAKIDNYESVIWPGIVRAYQRDPVKPPKDYWCGPLLDDPQPRDLEILDILRKLGVADARKQSKYDVHYGYTAHRCHACSMWRPDRLSQERGTLAECSAVSGLVRDTRGCELWRPAAKA